MEEHQTSNFEYQNKSQVQTSNIKTREKPIDLRERLLKFGKRMLQVARDLPKSYEYEGVRRQLARAGTSVGANFEEADGSITKKDFINKVAIARKEAKESQYWLKIIEKKDLTAEIAESEEIIKILSSILIKCGFRKRL